MVAQRITRRDSRGFTLPELLAVVAVLAIVASMAAPSFGELVAGQRAKGAAGDLFASLLRARSEAVKRNTEITVAPAAAGWQAGWTIEHPVNDAPIEQHGAVTGASIDGPDNVVYLPNGRVKGAGAPAFDIAVDGDARHRCVEVDLSGRPYQKAEACSP